MPSIGPSTVRQRRLGAELRRIREELGLTLDAAARRLNRTSSSLSKIERGHHKVRPELLHYALDQYGVTDERLRAALFALARDDNSKGWWQRYGDVLSPSAADYISIESDTTSIRAYETLVIPGLLQIADYARALIQTEQPSLSARQFDRFVKVRLARQQTLTRPDPPAYSAIIGETALRQQIGGRDVIREQLTNLLQISERENVTVRVLPFSADAHAGLLGPFEIMDLGGPAAFSVAIFENPAGRLIIDANEEVQRYDARFERIAEATLSPADSRTLIARLLSES